MSRAHDLGVTENRLHLESCLEEGFWDDVFFEKSYFESMDAPYEDPGFDKGREVGEFDYLAVNYGEKVFLYGEVKSSYSDVSKAREQLRRADDFFDDWFMVGQTYIR